MKNKTPGATPGAAGSPPTAPPAASASADPSTPSGLSCLSPGDARHEISAIRREFPLPSVSSASPLAGKGGRAADNRGGSTPSRIAGKDKRRMGAAPAGGPRGGRVGQGGSADNEEEDKDDGPAGEPVFPEVQRLLIRLLMRKTRPRAQAAVRCRPSPRLPPPAPSAPPRLPKIVIKGYRPAADQPTAAEKIVPSGNEEASAAAGGGERAGPAQGPKRQTKIKFVNRSGPSLPPPGPDNGNSGAGNGEKEEEEEEDEVGVKKPRPRKRSAAAAAGKKQPEAALQNDEPGGVSSAAPTEAAKPTTKKPRGRKAAPASALPSTGASQHQSQTLGLGEPGDAADNTPNRAPKPKGKSRAKKDAPFPAGPPSGTSQPYNPGPQAYGPFSSSSGFSGVASKPPGKTSRARKPSTAVAGPSTSAPEQPAETSALDESSSPLPHIPNDIPEQAGEEQPYGPLLDVVSGLASGALLQPSQDNNNFGEPAPTGPSQVSSEQSSLNYCLAEPGANDLSGDLLEYPDQADLEREHFNAALINPALGAPIPFPPLDPLAQLFPTVPVCFDANSPLTGRIWYPYNFQGDIDPHWETWPTRRDYPLTPGEGPCNPTDLSAEPDSTLPQAIHDDIQSLADQGTLFSRVIDSVNYAHEALDNCGYDFEREPLLAPIPRAVRAALARYRPYAFPRTGTNPFIGVELSGDPAEAGADGMENGDPEGRPLMDGVVMPPALPATISGGTVVERADNALVIPVEWKEAVTPRNENGRGSGEFPWAGYVAVEEGGMDIEEGGGGPSAAATAIDEGFNRMGFEGQPYVDINNDLEDDLYANSQAGDSTADQQGLEPNDTNTAMDIEHPMHPGAALQQATSADPTNGMEDNLYGNSRATELQEDLYGNSQAGDIATNQQAPGPEDNTAMDVEHPIYPGVAYQLATSADRNNDPEGDLYDNNEAGDITTDQQAPGLEHYTAMDVEHPVYPGAALGLEDDLYGNNQAGGITIAQQTPARDDYTAMDVEYPVYPAAVPELAASGINGDNGFAFGAAEEGAVDWNGLDDNAILGPALGVTPADMDAILPGGPSLHFPDYHPNNLNESATSNYDSLNLSDQAAHPDYHPNNLNEQSAAINDDFLNLSGIAQGQSANFNEQSPAMNDDFLVWSHGGQAAVADYHPNNLSEQSAAMNNDFPMLRGGQAAVTQSQPANFDEQSPALNDDFLNLTGQAAIAQNHSANLNEQSAAWNDDSLHWNGQAAIAQGQPANVNEQPVVFEDRYGNAWPNFEQEAAEWLAEMEAFAVQEAQFAERARLE
ncbi:hypothetical protein B0I37DRAFT_417437 [Chaetomium sp. MPI-CAGE-AT-0009]|nr:hypothetical protein B0I37DRAFT_417437 [Chaetomium sp. MPI-CAGE-AT-0009]